MKVQSQSVSPISDQGLFAAEDAKLTELKKSDKLEDKLTVVLMEAHVDVGDAGRDNFGLYFNFARPKALAIMERFNVTAKDSSSSLPKG
jgi:hypothetical protein